jgi:hypothetical protein
VLQGPRNVSTGSPCLHDGICGDMLGHDISYTGRGLLWGLWMRCLAEQSNFSSPNPCTLCTPISSHRESAVSWAESQTYLVHRSGSADMRHTVATVKFMQCKSYLNHYTLYSSYSISTLYQYRVYKKKLNRFEIALSFGKQLLVSSFLCI